MPVTYLTVANGQAVSSAATLQGGRGLALFVSSHAGLNWSLAFGVDSGGVAGWFPLKRPDGGLTAVVCSGSPGVGVVRDPPSPWVRIEASGATSAVVSCALVELTR